VNKGLNSLRDGRGYPSWRGLVTDVRVRSNLRRSADPSTVIDITKSDPNAEPRAAPRVWILEIDGAGGEGSEASIWGLPARKRLRRGLERAGAAAIAVVLVRIYQTFRLKRAGVAVRPWQEENRVATESDQSTRGSHPR
jgi:hypothetical protein